MAKLLMLLASTLLLCHSGWGKQVASADLTKDLLAALRDSEGYDKDVIPDSPGPVNVSIQIKFRGGQVDDLREEVKVDMTFRMKWHDPRLVNDRRSAGSEVSYGAVNDATLAWLPDLFFKQAVKTEQQKTINPQSYLRVFRDEPNMLYSTRIIVKFSCAMNFAAYPHDTQSCPLPIASYGYTSDNIVLNFDGAQNAIAFKPHLSKNFEMVGLETGHCDSTTATGKYSCVKAVLQLERKSNRYFTDVYVPSACLVIVAFLSEFIPRREFLAKAFLVLACFLVHFQAAQTVGAASPVAPYTKAIDYFIGFSQLILFSLLVKVILGNCSLAKKNEKASIIDHSISEIPGTLVEKARAYLGLALFGLYGVMLLSYYGYVCSL